VNEQLKKRLVGGAVLVSLAVIFLPMLLDEPPEDIAITETNIPPRPERLRELERVLPADGDLMLEPPAAGQPKPEPRPVAKPAPPAPAKAVVQQAKVTQPKQKPKTKPKPLVKPAPKPGPTPSAWVIQVASFSDYERARGLVKRLKAKKYPAFIKRAKIKGKYVYRVRVGPELDRKRVENIAARLDKAFKVKTKVQKHQ